MKVRIYQIVPELDVNHLMFRDLQTIISKANGKIPEAIYASVYEGELEAKQLEDVFYILNCAFPQDYRARSLSVSDVVEVLHSENESSFYFCDSFGFQLFPFDKTATHKNQEEKKMKCNMPGKYDEKNLKQKYGKNYDPRLVDLVENMDKLSIGLDEEFEFGCRMCGQCCTNRTDIMLNPKDLYNIAKELGKRTDQILDEYCESYIGQTSRIPIVRLRAIGYDKHCPLLDGKRCSVHKAKPTVCALFPLARAFKLESKEGKADPKEVIYLLQESGCPAKKEKHTVRQWLTDFGIPLVDQYHADWTNLISELSLKCQELEKKLSDNEMNTVYNLITVGVYLNYDTEQDFDMQFNDNRIHTVEFIDAVIEEVKQREVT